MATFSSVTQRHVLQAIAEHDARGSEDFLDVYGFRPAEGYELVHEGRSYDLRAVLGVAHKFATGRLATSEEFHSGMAGAVAILRRRGFVVTEPAPAYRSPQPRTTQPRAPRTPRAPAARTATRDAAPALCPTCSRTLPSTGVCDWCS